VNTHGEGELCVGEIRVFRLTVSEKYTSVIHRSRRVCRRRLYTAADYIRASTIVLQLIFRALRGSYEFTTTIWLRLFDRFLASADSKAMMLRLLTSSYDFAVMSLRISCHKGSNNHGWTETCGITDVQWQTIQENFSLRSGKSHNAWTRTIEKDLQTLGIT